MSDSDEDLREMVKYEFSADYEKFADTGEIVDDIAAEAEEPEEEHLLDLEYDEHIPIDADDLIEFDGDDDDKLVPVSDEHEFEDVKNPPTTSAVAAAATAAATSTSTSTTAASNAIVSAKYTGPRRFMLYDNLVAEIVDFDEQDNSPIVEFSVCVNSEDEEQLPVECGICPDIVPRIKLDQHTKIHVKPGSKRFTCIYCDEDFLSRTYAAGHARRHMGIRPYVCAPCKLYYCTKQDLRMHEQRRHWAKEIPCEQCDKTFAQKTLLKAHVKLVHEQQRRFKCEYCNKSFLRNYAKNEHIRNVHIGDRRPLDCPFCDMRFKDTHKLARHRKDKHLHQTQFECRACGLEFTSIHYFDAHRRSLQCRKKYKEVEEQRTKDLLKLNQAEEQAKLDKQEKQRRLLEQQRRDAEKLYQFEQAEQQMDAAAEEEEQQQQQLDGYIEHEQQLEESVLDEEQPLNELVEIVDETQFSDQQDPNEEMLQFQEMFDEYEEVVYIKGESQEMLEQNYDYDNQSQYIYVKLEN